MRKTLVLFLLVLLCSLHGFCQFDAGSILGAVTDGAGNQISGVKITLEDVNRGVTVTTLTGSDGAFQFPSVPISRYHIRTEATGFGVQTSQVFQLTLGARQRVDFQLHVEQVQTTVSVQATVPLVQAESSDRGQTIDAAQVRELPLNGRYYSDLV